MSRGKGTDDRCATGCTCAGECRRFFHGGEGMPPTCPETAQADLLAQCREEYHREGSPARELYAAFGRLVGTGGAARSRVEHVIEYSLSLGVKTIGIASCARYHEDVRMLVKLFESYGFTAYSAICKAGGFNLPDVGVESDSEWIACNPLFQARLLNSLGCELNVTLGLCMGHDLIFSKYSEGYVTNLVVKEKISGDNPGETLRRIRTGEYVPAPHLPEESA